MQSKVESMSESYKIISDNRQARFLYEILEVFEAGIALTGTEVKAIRAGKVNLRDGFAQIRKEEAFLLNVHISPHQSAGQFFNHEPRRTPQTLDASPRNSEADWQNRAERIDTCSIKAVSTAGLD